MSIIIGTFGIKIYKMNMWCSQIVWISWICRLQRVWCDVWMEWKNVWFYSSLFSFHRCYRRTWSCLPFISRTYSHRHGFNLKLSANPGFKILSDAPNLLQQHSALEKTKAIKVYFQNVEKFFLDTPYTTCIKTEAVNNYTKWRNQVDQYRRETNQVNTRKNPTIYKKSQEKFDWIECIGKLRCNKDLHIEF